MARNVERDLQQAQQRKTQMIQVGLKLFSSQGIEAVRLQDIAEQAGVGIATLYKYYQNKTNLVIAISGYIWTAFLDDFMEICPIEQMNRMPEYDLLALYYDQIIRLYQEKPEVLRFSGAYKTYMNRQDVDSEQLQEHLGPLEFIGELFHQKYESAKTTKDIRTDIPEKQLFTIAHITFLSLAERYAMGLVWSADASENYVQELQATKEMLLSWIKGN